jgi:regulator of RNase E activity RraA
MPAAHIATEVIETAVPDDVIVIDNRGSLDVSCWGGILTVAALAKGVTGVIIDGACRDIAESEAHGLPVFGRAVVPVSARGRIVQAAMDEPVRIDVALVRSEDFVIADRSGVVFVHPNEAERVITLAEKIAARETEMIAALRAGKSVVDVMHDSQFPSG